MAGNQDVAARLVALEQQVRRLSDELELYRLTASYAPAVDSGSGDEAGALWTDDGVYDVDVKAWNSAKAIGGLVSEKPHQDILRDGCGHVISLPRITVNGDTAVGTCHSRLYLKDGDGFRMWRVAANRWEFVRTDKGWRIKRRTNRLIDGTDAARDLFRRAFDDANEPLG